MVEDLTRHQMDSEYYKISEETATVINEAKRKNNFDAFFQTTIALTVNKNSTICFDGILSRLLERLGS